MSHASVRIAFRLGLALCVALFGVSAGASEMKSTAGKIVATPEEIGPLPVGSRMPDVEVQTTGGKTVHLSEVVGGQPAALVFFRGGWCPFCSEHLSALNSAVEPLQGLGVLLVALAPELPGELAKTSAKKELNYLLLSDAKANAAKELGIAFRMDDATYEKYKGHGVDIEARSGETHHALPVPAVFLVDAEGTIRFVHANPDYKVRLSNEKLIEAAESLGIPVEAGIGAPVPGKSGQ